MSCFLSKVAKEKKFRHFVCFVGRENLLNQDKIKEKNNTTRAEVFLGINSQSVGTKRQKDSNANLQIHQPRRTREKQTNNPASHTRIIISMKQLCKQKTKKNLPCGWRCVCIRRSFGMRSPFKLRRYTSRSRNNFIVLFFFFFLKKNFFFHVLSCLTTYLHLFFLSLSLF